jgi:lipoate-protein ligase A
LNRDVQITELRDALKIGFSEALDIKYVEGSLSGEEQNTVSQLAEEKYSTDKWNFSR